MFFYHSKYSCPQYRRNEEWLKDHKLSYRSCLIWKFLHSFFSSILLLFLSSLFPSLFLPPSLFLSLPSSFFPFNPPFFLPFFPLFSPSLFNSLISSSFPSFLYLTSPFLFPSSLRKVREGDSEDFRIRVLRNPEFTWIML